VAQARPPSKRGPRAPDVEAPPGPSARTRPTGGVSQTPLGVTERLPPNSFKKMRKGPLNNPILGWDGKEKYSPLRIGPHFPPGKRLKNRAKNPGVDKFQKTGYPKLKKKVKRPEPAWKIPPFKIGLIRASEKTIGKTTSYSK